MTNKNPETDYSDLTDALKFFFEQMVKGLYVCLPGIIDSYDPDGKRAKVHPAINMQETDGTTIQQSSVVNVPVVWPCGGGFTLLSPLPQGTPVVMFFTQRGLTQFKQVYAEADPGSGLFAKEDAFIVPGFGSLAAITPATEDGIVLQSEDGVDYISIEDGQITVETDGDVQVTADTLTGDITTSADITCPTVTITGNLIVTGSITGGSLATSGTGNATIGGDISATGAVSGSTVDSSTISLDNHVHGGVTTGAGTTGAAQ